ncbi:MAG: M14 family metallopeptidase [Deltaproteobacteria bacterium]
MKRSVKSILLTTLNFFVLGFLALSFAVNRKIADKGEVDPSMLSFFHESYDENRERFRRLAASLQREFSDVEISNCIVKSKVDSDLTIDAVYVPPLSKAKKLLIMTSGVHGMEGFTGSAVQQYFMTKVLAGEALENMGVLLVHAVNPYGFKYKRRVSESNVDMNRNFDINQELFERKNEAYRKIHGFLNPQSKVKTGYFRNGLFFLKTVYMITRFSMRTLREATVTGQYEFRNGIFYGGNYFEPQKQWLERLLSEKTNDYASVFLIDLHTGLGKRGKLHYLPGYAQPPKSNTLLEQLFKDYTIDWPNTGKEFYIPTGLFRQYVGNLIPTDKKFIRVAFEYGTLNSQHITGASRSLHNVIIENQGFHHGYENSKGERLVKYRFREMFFPSSEIWRSQIMKQTSEILPVLIDRYDALSL